MADAVISILLDELASSAVRLVHAEAEDIETGIIGGRKRLRHQIWNKIFVVSCVFAVLFDPLFLYIPVVKEDTMCLGLDTTLKIAALVLRTITDVFYLLDIGFHVLKLSGISNNVPVTGPRILSKREKLTKKNSLLCIRTDSLSVLPLPQVIIVVYYSKMWGSTSSTRVILNSLVLIQYVPRVFRLYLSGNNIFNVQTRIGIWIKGVFNFFPFILAGHILGAIWYSFAIQRETACWDHFCGIENGCEASTFSCGHNGLRNIKLLKDSCPLTSLVSTNYDFGIFSGALQYGMLGSTNFSKKLLQCFWWGLRNLSSLGSNLQPSSNQWENIFAVFIFFSGMILFLVYLSSTLQTLSVQLEAIKAEKLRFNRQMQLISPEIDLWLDKHGLPRTLKEVIIGNVKRKLEENKHVDVENILSILPLRHRKDIMTRLRLAALRKVPLLENMNELVLNRLSVHLKPMIYTEDNYVIREGEPLEKMIFITQGTAWAYVTSHGGRNQSSTKSLGKGDFCGEELLYWALKSTPLSELPVSTRIVKSQSKVEAFSIRANDLKTVVSKFWWHFSTKLGHVEGFELEDWQRLAASSTQAKWRYYQERAKNRRARRGDLSSASTKLKST